MIATRKYVQKQIDRLERNFNELRELRTRLNLVEEQLKATPSDKTSWLNAYNMLNVYALGVSSGPTLVDKINQHHKEVTDLKETFQLLMNELGLCKEVIQTNVILKPCNKAKK